MNHFIQASGFLTLLLLLQLTSSQVSSTQTLSYPFPFDGAPSALFNTPYKPVYQLGVLAVNYSLTMTLSLPSIGTDTLLATIASQLQSGSIKGLQYIDSTQNPSVLVRANAIVYPAATSKSTYSFTYAISFPSPSLTSASFIFDLTYKTTGKLYYYTLEATYFPSTVLQTAGSAPQSSTLLKVTDLFRSEVFKLIYVSQANSVFNFSATPAAQTCTNPTFSQINAALADAQMQFGMSSAAIASAQSPATTYDSAVSSSASASILNGIINLNNAYGAAYAAFFGSNDINDAIAYVRSSISGLTSLLAIANGVSDTGIAAVKTALTNSISTLNGYLTALLADLAMSGPGCVSTFVANYYSVTLPSSSQGFSGNGLTLSAATLMSAAKISAGIGYFTQNFDVPGFYLLEFQPAASTLVLAKVIFNTDPYACPYGSAFNDHFLAFQGCTRSSSSAGLPCLSFDAATQTCANCITGYILTNGACIANTTCPARQYFSYGACVNVSTLCGAFDAFTGSCFNCSDPANYDFNNGSCTRKAVTCAANQWQTNYTCYNASVNCSTFDPNTGKCLTCISNLYQLNTDGSCTLIVVNCPQGQYAVGLNCVTIPSECLNFDRALGKCLSCIKGYFVEGGVCKRVECPTGQVPSGYGIFCVNASPLCDAYDSLTGDCLSCKQKGYAVRESKCVQIGNGLAGCSEREVLGFGPCVGADLNCKIFNLVTGNCDECSTGFFLDYTGHCALSTKCGVSQWSVNGECLAYPDNCLKVDSIGLCTQCANDSYRLQHGQCVFFQSCLPQQFLNAAGQCVDANPSCDTFNPTNGLCITCKDAGTQPVSGVCCPAGQVYSSDSCMGSVALQNQYQSATGPSCLVRHPSLGFCLRCAEGYSPDYTVPYACAQN